MELFKLLGTIAIDNTKAKKALNETSQEGEKTQSKLSKAFSGIGKGAAAVGKTVATGLVAGAGAIATLGGFAVKAYSEYEQLVGGVETLFGTRGAKSVEEYAKLVGKSVKDVEAEFGMLQQAQSDVMKNAAKAYETAGLSTNEYMDAVNGMAAALNQSSASQLESAELADMAVIDMADNANKMGTSMEAIQNAYAGFTKQNFTMLDNLKLGYGGTKEEMQRLLDDAQKISGIKYDISSFADITQAIHVMQEEMGIAGTTANEASSTIQGSLGMLKSSWQNLMIGLSDPEADLGTLINNVFSSVTTFAGNLIPRISQVLTGIATSIKTLIPMLAAEIPGLLNQLLPPLIEGAVALVDGLVAALPGVLSEVMAIIPSLLEGLKTIFDSLIGALPQLIEMIVAVLPTLIPQLIDAVVGMIMMLVEMFPQIIQPIIDYLPEIIVSIVDALLNNLPVLIQGCIMLVGALIQAIPQILGALWEAIKGIFSSIGSMILGWFEPVKNAVSNAWNALGSVPGLSSMKTMIENIWGAIKKHISTVINAIKTVITTVWNSIKNVVSTVINSIKNVISTAWNAIKTIISNVMKLISSVLKGDWEGVKSAISNILNAIKSVISSIWNGIKNVISSVLNGIKNTVSSIWNGIKSVVSSALNTVKSVISSVWNGIKGTISGVVNGIKNTVTTGFNDVKNKVINAFKNLPSKLKSIGSDLVKGLWNGINNAKDWVLGKIKGFGKGILNGLKSFFDIKSPSRVMRDEVGKMLVEGVAEGITQNADNAGKSAEELGALILESAQKKLDNSKVYNDLTLADEVAFWDGIRQKCKEGTQARIDADQKYFEAKKSLNEQLVEAETELQNSLDEIYKKVEERAKSILGSFNLFEKFELDAPVSGDTLYANLHSQIAALDDYSKEMEELRGKIGGTALFAELESKGVGALNEIISINDMDSYLLRGYVNKFETLKHLATKTAKTELADETAMETQKAYQAFSDKCAELGIEIVESTETMQKGTTTAFETIANTVSSTTDKVTNALQRIKDAFESLLSIGNIPLFNFGGENLTISGSPSIFGYVSNSGNLLSSGESGSNIVAVSSQNSETTSILIKILNAILEMDANMGGHLREALEDMGLELNNREFARLVKAVD